MDHASAVLIVLVAVVYNSQHAFAGGTALKASVQQAAQVREHNWSPGGARMPLRLTMPPSTVRHSTLARTHRPHGQAQLTSVVRSGGKQHGWPTQIVILK